MIGFRVRNVEMSSNQGDRRSGDTEEEVFLDGTGDNDTQRV